MGIGVSIFFIAAGAILTFAVDATVSGLDLDVVGIVLMVVGAIGLLVSLFMIDSLRPAGVVREERVIRDPYA
jgi:hypothetical protein